MISNQRENVVNRFKSKKKFNEESNHRKKWFMPSKLNQCLTLYLLTIIFNFSSKKLYYNTGFDMLILSVDENIKNVRTQMSCCYSPVAESNHHFIFSTQVDGSTESILCLFNDPSSPDLSPNFSLIKTLKSISRKNW